MLGSEVNDYQVEVKGLQHRAGTREVETFDVEELNTDMKEVSISQGVGK